MFITPVLSVKGVRKFGRAFRDVAIVVGTRSLEQVKKHARAEQVKEVVSRTAKSSRWDKEENERFLEVLLYGCMYGHMLGVTQLCVRVCACVGRGQRWTELLTFAAPRKQELRAVGPSRAKSHWAHRTIRRCR